MKIVTPARIFVVGALLVVGSFYINSKLQVDRQLSADQLAAIYTGLGFVGLVATFRHEREQAVGQDRKHQELLSEMSAHVRATLYGMSRAG
jgi:hypothetical protein